MFSCNPNTRETFLDEVFAGAVYVYSASCCKVKTNILHAITLMCRDCLQTQQRACDSGILVVASNFLTDFLRPCASAQQLAFVLVVGCPRALREACSMSESNHVTRGSCRGLDSRSGPVTKLSRCCCCWLWAGTATNEDTKHVLHAIYNVALHFVGCSKNWLSSTFKNPGSTKIFYRATTKKPALRNQGASSCSWPMS